MREILSAVPTVRSASLRHRKCQKSNRCEILYFVCIRSAYNS
jgi:hypothetical protein